MNEDEVSAAVAKLTAYLRGEIEREYGKLQGFDQPVAIRSNQISAVIACLGAVATGLILKNQQLAARLDLVEKELAIRQVLVSTAAAKKGGSN